MAAVPITVPGVGESITEGILARWLKPDGAAVKAGEPLFELETDKASNVVPAAASGILKIEVAGGDDRRDRLVGRHDRPRRVSRSAKAGAPKPASAPAATQRRVARRALCTLRPPHRRRGAG